MQFSSAIGDQVIQRIKVVVNDPSGFEAINYLRTNVRAAANRRSVTESFRRFLDRLDYFSFSNGGLVCDVSTCPGQGAGTNERTCPGAKIFGAEVLTHHFTDVRIDVRASDVNEFTISVLILENFAGGMLEQFSYHLRNLAVLDLAKLSHSRFAGKIKFNYIAFNFHVPGPQRRYSKAAVFIGVHLAARSDKAG